ncbi:hypothetical protein [Mammaliicoccus sciuri]|uniref:hypothetical protein n=1 Tax=Mammaliicoccus sciuri TaxID=1296 RepID=UPI0021D2A2B9|nr:hypothetical protein [Mammaliicoccus sciuri]UXU70133.1 hypothetical protein MUA36_05490 [Mammaliicoccus sciuri]
MELYIFLKRYKIIESFEVLKENELIFENLNDLDEDLHKTLIDKSRMDISREYKMSNRVTHYHVYKRDNYSRYVEIKRNLTIEQLEEFIESL